MIIFLRPNYPTALADYYKAHHKPILTMQVFISKSDQAKLALGIIPEAMDVTTVVIRGRAAAPANYVLIKGMPYNLHYQAGGKYKLKRLK